MAFLLPVTLKLFQSTETSKKFIALKVDSKSYNLSSGSLKNIEFSGSYISNQR